MTTHSSDISRRTAIATLAALGSGAVLAQGLAARPVTVRLGYQKSSTLIAVLKAQGVLEKQLAPLNATLSWHEFTSGLPLLEALNLASWADLADWSTKPVLMPRCKIGKWRGDGKGTPYKDVDTGFLSWMLGKDFTEDDLYTARWHIEQREIDQRLEYERMELDRQFQDNGIAPEVPNIIEEAPARDTQTMELDL